MSDRHLLNVLSVAALNDAAAGTKPAAATIAAATNYLATAPPTVVAKLTPLAKTNLMPASGLLPTPRGPKRVPPFTPAAPSAPTNQYRPRGPNSRGKRLRALTSRPPHAKQALVNVPVQLDVHTVDPVNPVFFGAADATEQARLASGIEAYSVRSTNTAPLNGAAVLMPTRGLRDLCTELVRDGFRFFIDSGAVHSTIPSALLARFDLCQKYGISFGLQPTLNVHYPDSTPFTARAVQWDPMVSWNAPAACTTAIVSNSDRTVTLGRAILESKFGMMFDATIDGLQVFLDTGSAINVTALPPTHVSSISFAINNGQNTRSEILCHDNLNFLCIPEIANARKDFVVSTTVYGLQEWEQIFVSGSQLTAIDQLNRVMLQIQPLRALADVPPIPVMINNVVGDQQSPFMPSRDYDLYDRVPSTFLDDDVQSNHSTSTESSHDAPVSVEERVAKLDALLEAVDAELDREEIQQILPAAPNIPSLDQSSQIPLPVLMDTAKLDRIQKATANSSLRKPKKPIRTVRRAIGLVDNSLHRAYNASSDPDVKSEIEKLRAQLQPLIEKAVLDSPLYASNFGAASYQLSKLAAQSEQSESTPASFMRSLQAMAGGDLDHLPKRFGAPYETTGFTTSCTTIVPLAAMPSGATIYAFAPVSWANRGGVVAARVQGSTTWSVLGYLTPNVDLEEFSFQHAVLGLHQEVTMPTVYSGSATIVSQVQAEQGQFQINPLGIFPGKSNLFAVGRKSPIHILGAEPLCQDVICYTGLESDAIKYTGVDPTQTSSLGVANTGVGLAYPGFRPSYQIAVSAESISPTYFGWVLSPSDSNSASNLCAQSATTEIWRLSNTTEYWRHLLFGDIQIRGNIGLTVPNAAAAYAGARVSITYSDGTSVAHDVGNFATTAGIASTTISIPLSMDTRGNSRWASYRGLFIKDISLSIYAASQSLYLSTRGNFNVTFLDVLANETYSGWIFTGCQPVQTLQFVHAARSEVWVDPATTTGQTLIPSGSLPVSDEMVVSTLDHLISSGVVVSRTNLHAGGFKDFINRIGRAARAIASSQAQKHLKPTVDQLDPTGKASRALGWGAVSFGKGARNNSSTGVSFVIVNDDLNDAEDDFQHRIVEVIPGSSMFSKSWAPDFSPSFTQYSGASDGLAFAVAQLRQLGFNLPKGCYTGEIEEFSVNESGKQLVATVTVLPVDYALEKITSVPDLTGLFANGWISKGNKVAASRIFGRGVSYTVTTSPIDDPDFPIGSEATTFTFTRSL